MRRNFLQFYPFSSLKGGKKISLLYAFYKD